MISNPFLKNSPVVFEKDLSKEFLIKNYKELYGIDLTQTYSLFEKISIYKCVESGYRFYYPLELSGDSDFYKQLQQNDWYYMPWKWEHQESLKYIKDGYKILEVGCGAGYFLKNINKKFHDLQCVGLELNKNTVSADAGYTVHNELVENFSERNEEMFDIVCSYQVLEHISSVNTFLKANIHCLKENGFLIICVPNNDSFIRLSKGNILNMPPHHMGLWNENSLRKIGEHFNLKFIDIAIEPIQKHHWGWYLDIRISNFMGSQLSRVIMKAINLLNIKAPIMWVLNKMQNHIMGHSILIVFQKPYSTRRS